MTRLRRAALRSKRIQQRIQGTATKSILIDQGVMNKGARTCSITDKGASTAAPAILTVNLSRFIVDPSVEFCLTSFNLFKRNYSEMRFALCTRSGYRCVNTGHPTPKLLTLQIESYVVRLELLSHENV
ncbi:hypothetical protein GWM83_03460 [Candidatus Bathyarchaeota archaeon]|nr:hypothetical protein [Candidatus Bathyarchaeota archaeon]NIW16490.1 hypothetical protein [Candidatus Bathyarchaeota archaeon]NIW34599.1 hypothetical protein [Candidatus Bathyarchaeota archaeon]